jgi:tripartite ATP-independent transporter DctP family solute receptor
MLFDHRNGGNTMQRRTSFRQLAAVVVVAGALGLAAGAQAQTALKFSHTDQPGGLRQKAAEMFGQKIEQYTQGRYKLQVFPAGQLANDANAVEQLQLGGIDFTVAGTGVYATHLPTLNLMLMPYLVDNYEQGWKLYDESKWLKAQIDKAPEKGFHFLSTFEAGFRSMTTRDPVNSPAEAKGKKLRTYANEMQRWLLEAMGFSVQIMPLPEVYLAIQQGVVAGQENPIDTIHANRFYEVAPYVTLTKHVYSPIPLAISEKTWQKLSVADREAVARAAKEAAAWSRKEVAAAEEAQLADMQSKGAKIVRPNLEPFREAVKPAYVKAREKYGADVDNLLAEAESIRKAAPAK